MATGSMSPRRRIAQENLSRRKITRRESRRMRRRAAVRDVIKGFKLIEEGKTAMGRVWLVPVTAISVFFATELYKKIKDLDIREFKLVLAGSGVAALFTTVPGAIDYVTGKLKVRKKVPLLKPLVWGNPKAANAIINKLEPFDIPDKYLDRITAWGKGKEA